MGLETQTRLEPLVCFFLFYCLNRMYLSAQSGQKGLETVRLSVPILFHFIFSKVMFILYSSPIYIYISILRECKTPTWSKEYFKL
jgi:hypothetical protein